MKAVAAPVPSSSLPRRLLSWCMTILGRYTSAVSLIAFLLFWEGLVRIYEINFILLPPPTAIWLELVDVSEKGLLWGPLWDSGRAFTVGLAVAMLVGIPIGILVGSSSLLDLISTPYLWALRATPRIAIAPLLVLWIGFGFQAKVWMVFMSATVIMLLIVQEGVKMVDQTLIRVAQSFGGSRKEIYLKVVFPATLPFIANAIRNGIGMGIVAILVVEMFSAAGGIGSQVIRASNSYNGPRMFAFILVLVVISLGLITLGRRLEAYASRWREEMYV